MSTAFVLTCGCGAEESAQPVAAVPRIPEARTAEAGGRDTAALRVEVSNGRVRVEAHDAPALEVLEKLGEQARFSVVAGAVPPRTVSLLLEQAILEEAIGAILAGLPYDVNYRYDAVVGAHAIDAVRVGPQPANVAAASVPSETSRPAQARTDPSGYAIDLDRVLSERRAGDPDLGADPDVLAALADPREDVRAVALDDLGTSGEDLETTIAFARADPSPLVRGAAVDALGSDGRYAALSAVIEALDDRDPTVVLRAIASIEEQGDASLAPRLEPLTDHDRGEIRARAAAALEQLR